jgi:hypothetical protein
VRQTEKRQKLSNSGRRGAEKRWGSHNEPNGQVIAKPQSHPQSQLSVTPIRESKERKVCGDV